MRVQHPRFKVSRALFYYWLCMKVQSEAFVPINPMRSTWAFPSTRTFVFTPLLHVHAPHVASATQPVIHHFIFGDCVGVEALANMPGLDPAARNLFDHTLMMLLLNRYRVAILIDN